MHRSRLEPQLTLPEFGELLRQFAPAGEDHPLWQEAAAPSLVIDEVEHLWSTIDERDDWAPLQQKVADIRELAKALGPAPIPAGHI